MGFISKSTYDPYGEYKGKITDELLSTISREYDLRFDFELAEDLGGSYSRNILLDTTKGKFVARLYQSYVMISRLSDVQKVRAYLNESGISTTKVISTVAGKSFTSINSMLIEVEEFIEGDEYMNTWEKVTSGVKVLAKLHDLLKDFKVSQIGRNPLVANHVEVEYVLPWTQRGVDFVLSDKPTKKEECFCNNAFKLAHLITETQTKLYTKLPRQLTHGDYWDNNVFMDGLKVCNVIDFDFLGERARIDDIAYTIKSLIRGAYSREVLARVKNVLESYDNKLGIPLTKDEKLALPLSMARIALSFVGIIASLDTREQVSKEVKSRESAVAWALQLMEDIDYWQDFLV